MDKPISWDAFYAEYGRAVFNAQIFERNLAVTLYFLEARKRSILKRPSAKEIDRIIEETDRDTIGTLLDRLSEHQLFSPETNALFQQANENRRVLVHHFSELHTDKLELSNGATQARAEVLRLAPPITEAMVLSRKFALDELDRMQREVEARLP